MSPEAWIAVIAGIILPIGFWLLLHVIKDEGVQSELKARVKRTEEDVDALSGVRMDKVLSDVYGTVSNTRVDLEKRLDRIEKRVFNGHHE